MTAKKSEDPEGMSWTNSNCYSWKGDICGKGCGCVVLDLLLYLVIFILEI